MFMVFFDCGFLCIIIKFVNSVVQQLGNYCIFGFKSDYFVGIFFDI